MRSIESVVIDNVKGITHTEFRVGSLTVIRGDNGTGKSSILDALTSIFEGGHAPELIRQGAAKATVQITLSDGVTIKRTITPKTSTLDITTADGLKVPKPAAYVERLASGFSLDPIAFLEAPPKERAKFLMAAMPMEFRPEEFPETERPGRPLDLDGINQFRQAVYDRRRDANVYMKQLDGGIATMRESLAGVPEEPADVEPIRQRKSKLEGELSSLKRQIQSEVEAAKSKALADYQTLLRTISESSAAAESEQTAEINAELQTVASELAQAESAEREYRRAEGTRREINRLGEESRSKQAEVDRLTATLESIDALKQKRLSEAPIEGIEVRDGEIYVDGIPLDHVNTQRKYFVAFQVATLRPGELGFMVCDRAESLVGEQWEQFCEAAAGSGFQVIAARAEAGKKLTVEA